MYYDVIFSEAEGKNANELLFGKQSKRKCSRNASGINGVSGRLGRTLLVHSLEGERALLLSCICSYVFVLLKANDTFLILVMLFNVYSSARVMNYLHKILSNSYFDVCKILSVFFSGFEGGPLTLRLQLITQTMRSSHALFRNAFVWAHRPVSTEAMSITQHGE